MIFCQTWPQKPSRTNGLVLQKISPADQFSCHFATSTNYSLTAFRYPHQAKSQEISFLPLPPPRPGAGGGRRGSGSSRTRVLPSALSKVPGPTLCSLSPLFLPPSLSPPPLRLCVNCFLRGFLLRNCLLRGFFLRSCPFGDSPPPPPINNKSKIIILFFNQIYYHATSPNQFFRFVKGVPFELLV